MEPEKTLRQHMQEIAAKGGQATKKRLGQDPEYYKRIRAKRKSYPKKQHGLDN